MLCKLRNLWVLMVLALVLPLTGCGDEATSPTAPAATPVDEITVTLEHIDVIQACTSGFLQYKFYVVTTVDGKETTYLQTTWSTIQSKDGDLWQNLTSTSFELPRRAGAKFKVRVAIQEWVGTTVAWSQGRFTEHLPMRSREELWQPDFGGYASYSAPQRSGSVVWDINNSASCRMEIAYDVDIQPK